MEDELRHPKHPVGGGRGLFTCASRVAWRQENAVAFRHPEYPNPKPKRRRETQGRGALGGVWQVRRPPHDLQGPVRQVISSSVLLSSLELSDTKVYSP